MSIELDSAVSNSLWRLYSDALNRDLIGRWVRPAPLRGVLKTDLFDEALGKGLYPVLRPRAEKVVAIDISHYNAVAARRGRGQLLAVAADARNLPFADGVFDLVVSNSTLDHFEHFEELERALREIRRVLTDGGQMLLTLDNLANPLVALRNALPTRVLIRIGLVPYYVGITCGPSRLRSVLLANGFRVREFSAVLHVPRVAAVLAARLVNRYGSPAVQQRYLRVLRSFEAAARWPTRFVSGHYLAVSAFRA